MRVGVGCESLRLRLIEIGKVIGHEASEVDFGVFPRRMLQTETCGGLAKTGHGDLRPAEIDFTGENGTEKVGTGDDNAGFRIDDRRHVGWIGNGGGRAVELPVIEAKLAAIHRRIRATKAVILNVLTNSVRHFFTLPL